MHIVVKINIPSNSRHESCRARESSGMSFDDFMKGVAVSAVKQSGELVAKPFIELDKKIKENDKKNKEACKDAGPDGCLTV